MSNAYPPPGPEGREEGRQDRSMPPPYEQPYGQPYGTPRGQPAGPQPQPAYPPPQTPPQQPGHPPQQPGQPYPPPEAGWGQPPGAGWQQQDPWGYGPYGGYGPPTRPGNVLAGAIMSYVGATVFGLLGLLLLIGSASGQFLQGFAEGAGMPDTDPAGLRVVLLGFGGLAIVWSILVVVLAVFAQQGRNGARIALTVVGGVYLLLGLVGAIAGGAPAGLVGVVYVAIAVTLFWVGRANEWYRAQKTPR